MTVDDQVIGGVGCCSAIPKKMLEPPRPASEALLEALKTPGKAAEK